MILLLYRVLCAFIAVMAVGAVVRSPDWRQKAVAAWVLVPLVLRALLVK
jgi:hypothetical protein